MVYKCHYMHLIIIAVSAILSSLGTASTDPADVTALRDLYKTLNRPPVLKKWNLEDPCEESWLGVACSGSSVIHLKIQGLNLTGHLGSQLHNLHNLKMLDVSSNNIAGKIPFNLPPNATHINMACNYLDQNIPHTLPMLKRLRHLNLSHNLLSGPIGNFFTGLDILKEMDLSYNNFTGDLPSSFGCLKNLTGLFLQNNNFTGSVAYLTDLPLTDLNIQGNLFSGVIPQHFQSIPNLWIGSNKFHAAANSPPWDFPLGRAPVVYNVSRPPTTQANAIENHSSRKVSEHKKKLMSAGEVAFMVGGGTLIVTVVALFIAIRLNRLSEKRLKILESSHISLQSHPIISTIDSPPTAPEESPRIPPFNSVSLLGPRRLPPLPHNRTGEMSRRSFSRRRRFSRRTKVYSVGELQLASDSFSEDNFLGEGSLGPVYRAVFPYGQTLAVKNINMAGLSFHDEEETFLDVVSTGSRLRHPNIVALNGYCMEHGQHLLVYDYVRNLTLEDALHSDAYEPLSWALRLRIALGVAQALNYLHSAFSPPVAHGNLKAANILIDENLMPRVCDCGLDVLRPLVSNNVRAYELATQDAGYIAPDHGEPGISKTKSDVYAFGVLLLELLTARKPYDDSRPREEQYLGQWASSRIHENESLEQMMDPGIQGTVTTKALSRYADIVSLCIQPVKEFRPPMSEVVDSLIICSQKQNTAISKSGDITDLDSLNKSFRSTNSRFLGSPAYSYVSA